MLPLLLLLAGVAHGAYYLPGVTPTQFADEDPVVLSANKVTSTKTPIQFDYYDLPFCKRSKSESKAENLGERLSGDSLTHSPYEVRIARMSSEHALVVDLALHETRCCLSTVM